jgi:hypothetical protein
MGKETSAGEKIQIVFRCEEQTNFSRYLGSIESFSG